MPDSGRSPSGNGSGGASPMRSISSNGSDATAADCGCCAHSAMERTIPPAPLAAIIASSSSSASHWDTARRTASRSSSTPSTLRAASRWLGSCSAGSSSARFWPDTRPSPKAARRPPARRSASGSGCSAAMRWPAACQRQPPAGVPSAVPTGRKRPDPPQPGWPPPPRRCETAWAESGLYRRKTQRLWPFAAPSRHRKQRRQNLVRHRKIAPNASNSQTPGILQ